MLLIEDINFELPQIGKQPTMGYTDEFVEKKMISGKIRRIYKGRRFTAKFSYAFLTDTQIGQFEQLLQYQITQGYLNVNIDTPFGSYNGQAILEVQNEQTRFKYNPDTKSYVWVDWQIALKAVNYD